MAGLANLPAEVVDVLCSDHLDVEDVCHLRTTCDSMRQPAAASVKELVAQEGNLPPESWQVFPNAIGLRVFINRFDDDLAARLEKLALSLPSRLQTIIICCPDSIKSAIHPSVFTTFVEHLVNSPCAQSIKSFSIDTSITAETAGTLLAGLSSATHMYIHVEAGRCKDHTLRSFPPLMRYFRLDAHSQVGRRVFIDAAGLASCSKLKQLLLHLPHASIISPNSIAQLTDLRKLCVNVSPPRSYSSISPFEDVEDQYDDDDDLEKLHVNILTAASKLPHLASFSMPGAKQTIDVRFLEWQMVADMPGLTELELSDIIITSTHDDASNADELGMNAPLDQAPPADGITALKLKEGLQTAFISDLDHDVWPDPDPDGPLPDLPEGCMTSLLPGLKDANISWSMNPWDEDAEYGEIVAAFQDHEELQSLHIQGVAAEVTAWPMSKPLRSIQRLQSVVMEGAKCGSPDYLLRDAAGCKELQVLQVTCVDHEGDREWTFLSGRGLLHLARGPASNTLRKVSLSFNPSLLYFGKGVQPPMLESGFSVVQAAALLRKGRCPNLCELKLDIWLDPDAVHRRMVRRIAGGLEPGPGEPLVVETPGAGGCSEHLAPSASCVTEVLQEKLVNAGVPWPGLSDLSCEPRNADMWGTTRCLWQVEGVAGKCYVSLQVYIAYEENPEAC